MILIKLLSYNYLLLTFSEWSKQGKEQCEKPIISNSPCKVGLIDHRLAEGPERAVRQDRLLRGTGTQSPLRLVEAPWHLTGRLAVKKARVEAANNSKVLVKFPNRPSRVRHVRKEERRARMLWSFLADNSHRPDDAVKMTRALLILTCFFALIHCKLSFFSFCV